MEATKPFSWRIARYTLAQYWLPQSEFSTYAAGDWLRRTGEGAGLVGLDRINRRKARACDCQQLIDTYGTAV